MTGYLQRTYHYADPAFVSVFDEMSFWSSRFGALLVDNMPIMRDANVLDIGFGAGFPLIELAHIFGQSSRFYGVDVWEGAMRRTASKVRYHQLNHVYLTLADGAGIPFPGRFFDLIVSNLGINNFNEPQTVMEECARVTQAGGRIILTTNTIGHMREFYNVYRAVLLEWGNPDYLERLAQNENHRGSQETVRALLENAGFMLEKVVEGQFPIRFSDGSAMLNHSLIKIGFLDGWRSAIDAKDEAAIFADVENRLNHIALEQGEFKVTIPMLYVQAKR